MLLQNLQAELADNIVSGQEIEGIVFPNDRLSIYTHNMQTHLLQTLRDSYPLISKLLGHDFFDRMARDYITQYPSRSGNLYDYGQYFSIFLSESPATRQLIYLTEVAEFEWACHRIYTSAHADMLDTHALSLIPAKDYEHLFLVLNPASELIPFRYPILRIIELCKEQQAIDQIDLNEGGVNLLIIRRNLDICLAPQTQGHFAFLSAIQEGMSLAGALDHALEIDAEFDLEKQLPLWVQNKTIVDFYTI